MLVGWCWCWCWCWCWWLVLVLVLVALRTCALVDKAHDCDACACVDGVVMG